MNEQRAFTIVVTGCSGCPHLTSSSGHGKLWCRIGAGVVSRCITLYEQNKKAITPTCPMWNEAKPLEELK